MNDHRKVGLLLAGALGMTGSAIAVGLHAIKEGRVAERYGVTSHPLFSNVALPRADAIMVGGWEHKEGKLYDTLAAYNHVDQSIREASRGVDIPLLPGIITDLDYPADSNSFARRPVSISQGASWIRDDIIKLKRDLSVDRTVVVFLGSPSKRPGHDMSRKTLDGPAEEVPSGLIYAIGACEAGADFVDFTPGYPLEYSRLWSFAEDHGVRIAGRDGSTGQTMIKVALSELFARRGLVTEAWYSTNLIGNHDGLVLSAPDYGGAKMADKRDALPMNADSNVVDIRYIQHWGDRKESWDAGELKSWLGGSASIRINWRGSDSELAAPLVVDIARLLCSSTVDLPAGFVPALGFFFKRPFLRETWTLSERWSELIDVFTR